MDDTGTHADAGGEIETALLDAELFIKYRAADRAINRLQTALERYPRSIELRERLREIAATSKHLEEAARQCLALANLYISREDFDRAHNRLLEAKQLDPRISITSGLEAIRRARRPDLEQSIQAATPRALTLAGDLAVISIFDAVQVIENARLTGALAITSGDSTARVHFNEGRIVGAEAVTITGEEAFRVAVEATAGSFDFERATEGFPVTINAASNTNLILDTLRQMDEEKK